MDNEPKLSDIPSIQKLKYQLEILEKLQSTVRFWSPVVGALGEDSKKLKHELEKLPELREQFAIWVHTLEHFNEIFADRGWIMYTLINMDVATAAVQKAQAGDVDGAEQDLADHYSAEMVKRHLIYMNGVKAFRLRLALAHKALEDYSEQRYHACVPVVLALIDGMVNEIKRTRQGFFASNADLTAWDSIAAHSKGLGRLTKALSIPRDKTCTETISLPYRHGILHGMDLGYDNQLVAAKTWATLFAARDWALKAERNELVPPPPKPQPTLKESFAAELVARKNLEITKSIIASWQPRIDILIDIPAESENPSDFQEGSPEQYVVKFLSNWKLKNFGYMAKNLYAPPKYYSQQGVIKQLREKYGLKTLKTFKVVEVKDVLISATEVKVIIMYLIQGIEKEESKSYRVVSFDKEDQPSVRGHPNAAWYILSWEGE